VEVLVSKRRMAIVWMGVGLLLSGCAGRNPLTGVAEGDNLAGFWWGLVQGMICPIAFVVSLFNPDVSIYEVHNSGAWYNAGFIIGAGAWGILSRGGRSLRDFDDEKIRKEAMRRGFIA
jgi:hypothetical protein